MKKIITSFFVIILIALNHSSIAQISGTVFHDYNGDGIQNNTPATAITVANIETGIAGVIIKAFSNFDVLIATQITGSNGIYTFPVGTGANQVSNGAAVRLEYVLPQNCVASSAYEFSAFGGFTYGSNVQFKIQAATAVTANFGIINFAEYRGNNNNPRMIVPRHTNGNPLALPAGTSATQTALYVFNYTASGQTSSGNNARTSLATAAQIGTCWGTAYNKYNDRIYTSAFLKRHAGLGPGGPIGSPNSINAPGAIYLANPNATNSGSFFFSMDALGAAYYTHDHTIGAALNVRDNVTRGLNKDIDTPSGDADAFDQVGKVGNGDIELSDDGRYMWLTNLYNKKLYRIDLTSAAAPVAPTAATASALITSWALPVLACNNGVLRSFGIKYYKGKIYVGVVCTGETELNANSTINNNTNVDGTIVTGGSFNTGNAYILQFTATGAGVWNTMLTIPLNYPRGNAADEDFAITRWYNWTNNFNVVKVNPTNVSGALIRPQPILANIEFDVDGTMMIGFMDRLGNQAGLAQSDTNGNSSYFAETGGDILRAYNNGCSYQLETNGKEGAASPKPETIGKNHGQGPGSGAFSVGAGSAAGNVNGVGYGSNYGEFYHNDRVWYSGGPYFAHNESSLGGLAFLYGSNELMVTSMDPLQVLTNGVNRYNNTNGDSVSRYEVITYAEAGTFGKANSLGDVEIITSLPPIEIGNRVWNDTNGNGIQDAGENGISGVMLEIYNPSTSSIIGNVTTSSDGSYYFTSAAGTDITGIDYGVNILPNTNYILRLATTGIGNDWDPTVNSGAGGTRAGSDLNSLLLTTTAAIGAGAANLSDNDAVIIGSMAQVSFATGEYGQNNHNIDFGFKPSIVLPMKIISFTAFPKASHVNLQWVISEQTNILTYDVETSTDGSNFTNITTVSSNGNQSVTYDAIHIKPVAGINYYRIKIIDKDGTISYSQIRTVNFSKGGDVIIYPNPVSTCVVNITLTGNIINKSARIIILSIEGKLISQQQIIKTSQTETIDVSTLPKGSYIIRFVTDAEIVNKTLQVID
jgi:hypothetical protein